MDWWYWFGMWVAVISGALLAWWVLIDSWRNRVEGTDLWPIATMLGMGLQLPSLALDAAARSTRAGALFAIAGVSGIVIVGVSAIAHFSRDQASVLGGLDSIAKPIEQTSRTRTTGMPSAARTLLGTPRPVEQQGVSITASEDRPPAYDGSATILDTDAAPTLLAERSDASRETEGTPGSDCTIIEDGATLLAEGRCGN